MDTAPTCFSLSPSPASRRLTWSSPRRPAWERLLFSLLNVRRGLAASIFFRSGMVWCVLHGNHRALEDDGRENKAISRSGPNIRDTTETVWALAVFFSCLDLAFIFIIIILLLYMYPLLLGVSGFGTKCANLCRSNISLFSHFLPLSPPFLLSPRLSFRLDLVLWGASSRSSLTERRAQTTLRINGPNRIGGRPNSFDNVCLKRGAS
ncbi:hypothetical protein VTH06DRAFT_1177 [Thermothelomyces fergusii]